MTGWSGLTVENSAHHQELQGLAKHLYIFTFCFGTHPTYLPLTGPFQKNSRVVTRTDKPLVFLLSECESVIQS